MARPKKGVAKRNRGCNLCKPHRAAGNGGGKASVRRRDPLTLYPHHGHRLAPHGWDREV